MELLAYEICEGWRGVRSRARPRDGRAAGARFAGRGCNRADDQTTSISTDVNNPAARSATFDEVEQAYYDQVRGMLDGGVDLILVETIFDTLKCEGGVFLRFEIV